MITIRQSRNENILVFAVEGVLDIFTVDDFDAALTEVTGVQKLVIDLSAVTFLDSTGIGAILRAIYQGQDHGFTVELSGMNEEIKELFDTVGILRVLEALQKGER
ncbi:STAS domain-containing protein [Brevibacillus migulae]|uniref:STAS domain-containing protein n=1 Tax=Brevibacillus migulae TaxID=1644114 RepID=UPI00106E42C5|nr:STAS domain-containing protein [Brevibacillus migulae]